MLDQSQTHTELFDTSGIPVDVLSTLKQYSQGNEMLNVLCQLYIMLHSSFNKLVNPGMKSRISSAHITEFIKQYSQYFNINIEVDGVQMPVLGYLKWAVLNQSTRNEKKQKQANSLRRMDSPPYKEEDINATSIIDVPRAQRNASSHGQDRIAIINNLIIRHRKDLAVDELAVIDEVIGIYSYEARIGQITKKSREQRSSIAKVNKIIQRFEP